LCEAAIHKQFRSSDVAAVFGREEHDGLGDLIRSPTLVHIMEIRADPEIAHGWWHGLRMPGTNIPGVLTAGTFYQDGKRVFWDVHNPENTVVIELKDERYNQLIVEVADPNAAVELVKAGLRAKK
jgi:hypothetical protein